MTLKRVHAAQPAQDEAATFQAVFNEHYTRVYGVLFRLVADKHEAEDLTLETFWRLWQQPPARADNLAGWLYRVATRLGYNALRATRRRAQYEGQAIREAESQSEPADPAREAERSEERARVHAALSRLPERDAQLLILRHSGLSYKELAATIGVSPNSVGTLLTRAEQEFERSYLEGESDAPRR